MEKIFINARFLTQHISGVQRFAIEVCKQLKQSAYADKFELVCPSNILHNRLASELNARVVGNLKGHMWEQLDLPRYLKKHGSPVLLNLANAAPLAYHKNIVTIHDLSVYQNPKWFSFVYRNYYRVLTPLIAKKALMVLTVSNAVKSELMDKFSLAESQILVLYNGISDIFLNVTLPAAKSNYLLTVSSIDPRKNIESLIKAFSLAEINDHELLIIGGKAQAFAGTALETIIENNPNVKLLGRVDDNQLVKLYSEAKLFVYLSLYEGFGIPNIEAMAMGVPVLTSNILPLKEVCGGAAHYVMPTDLSQIAEQMKLLLQDEKRLAELSALGQAKSKQYRWRYSAEKLLNMLSINGFISLS